MTPLRLYPEPASDRDRWILEQRPSRVALDPLRPYLYFTEDERSAEGEIVPVATVFLTNRECPWRCLMCDLWRNTLTHSVPQGAIPAQIDFALARIPAARHLKLYNSGSFFDRQAIPVADYPAIAARANGFENVIVESHPALVGELTLRFRDLLRGRLEVAMGLETVHPNILPRLNKRMTLPQFAAASEFLRAHGMDLRVFVLVKPPFLEEDEAGHWAARSVDFAFDCGATAVTLIPTRAGNGAMDTLERAGEFAPPRLKTLEDALVYGLSLQRGRVFADVWDVKPNGDCGECFSARVVRLRSMNLSQCVLPRVHCEVCE